MNNPCPKPEELLRLIDGELTENRGSRLRSHLSTCRSCAQELEAQERLVARIAATVDGLPSPGAAQAVLRRLDAAAAPRPRDLPRWRAALLCAGGLATVAALAFVALPRGARDGGEFRTRGAAVAWTSKVGIEVWALEATPRKLAAGARVAQGTAFVASYSNVDTAPAHLLAFALDGEGEVHWLYPGYEDASTDPAAVRLEPRHVQQALPEAVALEGVPVGPLRIVWIISRGPLRVSSVEAPPTGERTLEAVRARFPGAVVGELVVRVEAPPPAHP